MILSALRLLLFPLSVVYGLVVALRSALFQFGILSTYNIPGKSICVGNLSTGGTGKSPHVLYLIDLLSDQYQLTVLSRGYGRKSTGFREVHVTDSPIESGDEPLMIKTIHPEIPVFVCEKRKEGVVRIREQLGQESIILLDDAFQHRWVKAGLQIIITEFKRPFYTDFLLPAGNLREWRRAYRRADVVVMSKCPNGLIDQDRQAIQGIIKHKPVFFSQIKPQALVPFTHAALKPEKNILAVSGIGNPKPFIKLLEKHGNVSALNFPDHHEFSPVDIQKIRDKFGSFADANKMIVITEKDAVKLRSLKESDAFKDLPVFVQPIAIDMHNEEKFIELIEQYVREI